MNTSQLTVSEQEVMQAMQKHLLDKFQPEECPIVESFCLGTDPTGSGNTYYQLTLIEQPKLPQRKAAIQATRAKRELE